ncbi:hypothetical protein F4560_006433 [Saccharothrix ecbatanensis]|uniref:Uncharacterized protein n=1 Tax=Saccharothrix ecbatanensis TaxID=1105145 RepID=A0A7W9M426_9PSEU|nr:hypothetical protein [Saccharothrix ecbatanensis]MBB5806665.1 hypothetical protein [Saccharothrix ecbatanensis]
MDYDLPPWHSGADRPERVLERAVSAALGRPEVTRAVASGQVTRDVLIDSLAGAETAVLAAAGQAEQRYRTERPGWYARFAVNAPIGRWVLLITPVLGLAALGSFVAALIGLSWAGVLAVVGGAAVLAVVVDLLLLMNWSEGRFSRRVAIAWLACGVLSLTVMQALFRLDWPGWALLLAFVGSLASYSAAFLSIRTLLRSFRHSGQDGVARAALVAWEESVLVDGVLPVLYSKLNEVTPPVHATVLAVREVSSLVRADPLRMHVPTPAGAVLAGLVDRLDGGSFAVAGPRGAGKTNLLRAFCGGRYRSEDRAPDLAVLVSAPVDYVPQEFVVHLFAEVCEAVIDRFGQRAARRRGKVGPHPLVSLARDHLAVLNYVRTYADEISGKGGFKGFELAGKRAVTMAGRALTYPEVVKRFRGFLSRIAAEQATERELKPGRVVIGIDELDRIGAGEPARRLLNEVKAVFDVQGCYYLVSVSTEAQHDFELSGIGLRSVFDSSFDEVVRVDYLDFEYARKLLRRYVLDLSEQFQALAYVFSGGLARQLVRTARAIVELGREQPGREIADVVQALVDAELTRACQATADALTAVDDRDGVTDLLRLLDERRTTDLKTHSENLRAAYKGRSDRARQLKDTIAARTRFLATVQETFTADLTEDRMRALDFNELARARRYAGTNPDAGLALLRDIERRWAP